VPDRISAEPMGDGILLLSTREDLSDSDIAHVRKANLLNQKLSGRTLPGVGYFTRA
jgi:hypothetical protein